MLLKAAEKNKKRFHQPVTKLDVEKTRFLLVAVSDFTPNQKLPGTLTDVANLKKMLLSPTVGLPESSIVTLVNPEKQQVLDMLKGFAEDEYLENIFFYFSGTGTVQENILNLAFTPVATNVSQYNLVPVTELDDALGDIDTNVILIFDCCHSQAAFLNFFLENLFVLSSAGIDQVTYEMIIDGEMAGVFTNFLVKVLKEGMDNGKASLNLADVYKGIWDKMSQAENMHYLTEPKMMATNFLPLREIARNNAYNTVVVPKVETVSSAVIKNLIAENELEKALDTLHEILTASDGPSDDLVMLRQSHSDLESKIMLNLLMPAEATVFKSRFVKSLLDFVNRLKNEGFLF